MWRLYFALTPLYDEEGAGVVGKKSLFSTVEKRFYFRQAIESEIF